jgi:hypothetical protein
MRDGDRLARDGGLVERRLAGLDRPVERDAVPGADDDDLAALHVGDGDLDDPSPALDAGVLWSELAERLDGFARPLHRPALERVAEREEEEHQGPLQERSEGGGADCGDDHEQLDVEPALPHGVPRVAERKQTATRHRRDVEGGREEGRADAETLERVADPEERAGGDHEGQLDRAAAVRVAVMAAALRHVLEFEAEGGRPLADLAQARDLAIVLDHEPLARVPDARREHPGGARDGVLEGGRALRAVHPPDDERQAQIPLADFDARGARERDDLREADLARVIVDADLGLSAVRAQVHVRYAPPGFEELLEFLEAALVVRLAGQEHDEVELRRGAPSLGRARSGRPLGLGVVMLRVVVSSMVVSGVVVRGLGARLLVRFAHRRGSLWYALPPAVSRAPNP